MFSTWIYQFQNDPKFKSKVLFFISSGLLIVFLIVGIILLNTAPNVDSPRITGVPLTNPPQVTTQNFDQGGGIEKIDDKRVGLSQQVYFVPGGLIYTVDDSLKLRVNGKTFEQSPALALQNFYTDGERRILNENFRTTILNLDNSFTVLPGNVFSLTPLLLPDSIGLPSLPGYLYLERKGNLFSLKQTTSLNDVISSNGSARTLVQIQPGSNVQLIEIRLINSAPYVVFYDTISRQGLVEIFKVEGNNLVKAQSINRVQSIKFGKNAVLVTTLLDIPTDLTPYNNLLIDFRTDPKGIVSDPELAQNAGKNQIFGSIIASRCDFSLTDELFCLAKIRKVNRNEATDPDAIFRYNLNSKKFDLPYSTLTVSGESLFVSSNNQVYIVSQVDQRLYRLK
jgi:hypothetical protein